MPLTTKSTIIKNW